MYTQGFGEILVDILSTNPALADVSSASSILDTSNYTFQAITFGKDSQGFDRHAHIVLNEQLSEGTTSVSSYNNQLVIARNYTDSNSTHASSYDISATYRQFSSVYNSVPAFPAPNHTRLEQNSTLVNSVSSFSSAPTPDLGHYINAGASASPFSGIWNVIGGFPPSGYQGWDYFLVSSDIPAGTADIRGLFVPEGAGVLATSGQLSGVFNADAVMDKNGFLTFNSASGIGFELGSTGSTVSGSAFASGAVIFSSTTTEGSGITNVAVRLKDGDAASLALFGGFNHIGVWCLDLKGMLEDGITPPFVFDPLDNIRRYKLVSKVTFWDNLLSHKDKVGDSGSESGLQLLADDSDGDFTYGGPTYLLRFKFA